MKIVTLNTWKCEGDYDARLERMADGLARLEPDAILLQECFVCEQTQDDTARYLADRLRLRCAFGPARAKLRRARGQDWQTLSGLAILARGALENIWRRALPSSEIGGERIALGATWLAEAGRVNFVCGHFSHVRGEEALRAQQIEQSLREAAARWPGEAFILGGDFNCEPPAAEAAVRAAAGELDVVNCLPRLGVDTATSPYPQNANKRSRQIDQIWLVAPDPGPGWRLESGGVALTEPLGKPALQASDHAAVWVELANVGA